MIIEIFICLSFIALFVLFLSYRYIVVGILSDVRTRDLKTLGAVRKVLKLLCAEPLRARLVLTKDRSAYVPGASRRHSRRR